MKKRNRKTTDDDPAMRVVWIRSFRFAMAKSTKPCVNHCLDSGKLCIATFKPSRDQEKVDVSLVLGHVQSFDQLVALLMIDSSKRFASEERRKTSVIAYVQHGTVTAPRYC